MRSSPNRPARRAVIWVVVVAVLTAGASAAVLAQSYYDRRDYERYDRRQTREDRRAEYCRELEQRLVNDWRRANSSRDDLPRINKEIRKLDRQYHKLSAEAERRQCYEDMFIFGRSLRRTRKCVKLDREIKSVRRELKTLQRQRDTIRRSGSGTSRQDQLIAELARHGCGEDYVRRYEAQRRSRSFFSFWEDGDFRSPSEEDQRRERVSELPFATYRTMCVRECDGYYFPISFSTLPSQFAADEAKCHERCAAPASLFIYRNPGEEIEQMVSLSGQPYSQMDYAWRYRKHFIKGCSCSAEEFSVADIAESERKLAAPSKADGKVLPEDKEGREEQPAAKRSEETSAITPDTTERPSSEQESAQASSREQPIITDLPARPEQR